MKYFLHQICGGIAIFLLMACTNESLSDHLDDESTCFSFDIRQCATDPWLEFDDLDNESSILKKTKGYLSERVIEVDIMTIDMNFHEIVCEACGVCPQGPRIFIKTNPNQEEALRLLPLFTFDPIACSDIE